MKLIDNWRQAPKMYSVQALAVIGALQTTASFLSPEQLLAPVPFYPMWTWGSLIHSATAFVGITGTFARLISQDLPKAPE